MASETSSSNYSRIDEAESKHPTEWPFTILISMNQFVGKKILSCTASHMLSLLIRIVGFILNNFIFTMPFIVFSLFLMRCLTQVWI